MSEDDDAISGPASPTLTLHDLILDRALDGDDPDEFQRAEIAARIAELACNAELPLNIGLFGPWGSGKSSMFLLIQQAIARANAASTPGGEADVVLIRYDAWKYGGHSLRRNFISNAASSLGIDADDSQGYRFHRGLYEQRRSAEIQTGRFFAASVRAAISFAWLFLLFILLSAAVVAITSWLTGKKVGEISPKLLTGGGIVTLILALARAVFETGTVQVEQTRPSDDEEFSAAFRALIKRATARLPDRGVSRHLTTYRHWRLNPQRDLLAKLRRWWSGIGEDEQRRRWQTAYPGYRRLIFFIDELDRCAEADVVKTLNALRTFLDERDCAFIVAADRDVLEQALQRDAEQVTPINPEAPYYSAAGAFLDKIFQYQIGLPPLRRRRLTAFARERVHARDVGIWSELRAAGLVDRVLPALIPTQVHSPRRVKVLLNNFAASARIAQSRSVQWPQRAPEIAKLVALQTEFPHFAQALASEPRLARVLLSDRDGLPDDDSLRALWDRFRAAGSDEVFLADEGQPSYSASSRRSDRHEAWDQMTKRQAQNLLNFLRATDDIDGPQSDLIYLEPAGASFGLEDPVLGDRIERDAADVPEEVIVEIAERDYAEQGKAIQLLASIMPDAVGRQRANELVVLLDTAERLVARDELQQHAALAAGRALHLYLAESELDEEQLLGALMVAITARDESLIAKIFADDRLLIDDDRVQSVAALFDRLPSGPRAVVAQRVAEQLAQTPSVLVEPMRRLPEEDAVQLYASGQLRQAVELSVQTADESSSVLVTGLVESGLPVDGVTYPAQLRAVLDHLIELRSAIVYPVMRAHLAEIREGVRDDARFNRYVLTLWSQASGDDWERWCEALLQPTPNERVLVPAVLVALFEGYAGAPSDAQERVPEYVRLLLGHLGWPHKPDSPSGDTAEILAPVLAALEDALRPAWWNDVLDRESRQRLFESAGHLAMTQPLEAPAIDKLLEGDLLRALQQSGAALDQVLGDLRVLARGLSLRSLKRLTEALLSLDLAPTPERPEGTDSMRVLTARAALARFASIEGGDPGVAPFAIPTSEVRDAMKTATDEGDAAVVAWLRLEPSAPAVGTVLAASAHRSSRPVRTALEGWGKAVTRKQRTKLIERLLRGDRETSHLIAALARGEFEEAPLIRAIGPLIKDPRSNRDERMRLARQAAALAPTTPSGQRALADLIVWLLDRRRKRWPAVDVEVALAALHGLGDRHASKRRLEAGFDNAAPSAARKLTSEQIEDFHRANLAVPRAMIKKSWRHRLLGR